MTGPAGVAGRDAFDLVQWAPDSIRRMFRESAEINIYFNSAKDGVIFNKEQKPIGLKNRGKGASVNLVENFPQINKIKGGNYEMELKNSLFKVKPVDTGTTSPSTAIFCLSFKADSMSKVWRCLFSNENYSRAIMIKDGTRGEGVLKIWSSGKSKEIAFDNTDWKVLILQYTCLGGIVGCDYLFDGKSGSLEVGEEDKKPDYVLYLGGHPKLNRAHHSVGSFEMYQKTLGEGEKSCALSEEMKKCLYADILQRVDGDE